jgi:hypothetical protein
MHPSCDTVPAPYRSTGTGPRLDASALLECDFCGRAVRREAAFERVHRGDDGVEVVILCSECELGDD